MVIDGDARRRRVLAARARPGVVGFFTLLFACTADGAAAISEESFAIAREQMVSRQIAARGVRDARVLVTLREVPRHRFVPSSEQPYAYEDGPLPIGHGQTISQPYIVALMTELARPAVTDRVLEIGTGSGYQAAVLARLVSHVYTIEIVAPLARAAETRLRELGYRNVTVRAGDGYLGWPESAPFDIIMVTAAPDHIPQPLLAQLKPDGRMVVPLGPAATVQELRLIEKDASGELRTTAVTPVKFVPLLRSR
jgi:protein-L-isoaspartate(D-aspartate) O-methyltransferase